MSRYQLDRDATTGERALGAALVSILALALGVASYLVWVAAFRYTPPDPVLLALSLLSAAGGCLLFRSLYKTLKAAPVRPGHGALMAAACILVALGMGALAFAVIHGARAPHVYASATISLVMGARYILAHGRRRRPG